MSYLHEGCQIRAVRKGSLLHVDRYLTFPETDLCELDKYTSRYRVICSIAYMSRLKQGVLTSTANIVWLDIVRKMPARCTLRVY